ncbi:NADPH-dependent F420 reductase [Pseudoalteromonas sp. S16_S37]|uniref:NADPH-dependent F420 reductase n=1 Tax=Pseudoalteromonas sp. S16_S37 TaxID=2720228 RepID=UPI00168017B0|nr:NADPH-dependent F420 reductase [Pseudoalteromonas sp. S16_S37]MBD1582319.1 NADPH-dependent F420 reductase [Pseudoalteromonas sp. S16_S37]
MKIGFIGAGAMAQTLAYHALRSGHQVMLSNSRGPESLAAVATRFGCQVGTSQQAAEFGDVVVIAVPLYAYNRLPKEQLEGKVVLDLLNYFPHRDGYITELNSSDTTTSELLASYLTGSKVVKAFNSITVQDLQRDARPQGAADRRAIPIASNDAQAKELVAKLIDDFGFDVADGGKLSESWRFERFRPAYCVAAPKDKLERILASTTQDTVVADGHWLHTRYV